MLCCYAMRGTEMAMLLRDVRLCCYAMCGTEIGYAATSGAKGASELASGQSTPRRNQIHCPALSPRRVLEPTSVITSRGETRSWCKGASTNSGGTVMFRNKPPPLLVVFCTTRVGAYFGTSRYQPAYIRVHRPHYSSRLHVANHRTLIPCAVCGTEIGYAATRMLRFPTAHIAPAVVEGGGGGGEGGKEEGGLGDWETRNKALLGRKPLVSCYAFPMRCPVLLAARCPVRAQTVVWCYVMFGTDIGWCYGAVRCPVSWCDGAMRCPVLT
eukprot:3216307-Rhodomonas_salina.2